MSDVKATNSGKEKIAPATIEAFSRSIYREACQYGFDQIDFIRLINRLMDSCSSSVQNQLEPGDSSIAYLQNELTPTCELPIRGATVSIREFQGADDARLLESWLPDKYGRYFVLSGATAQKITVEALTASQGNHLGIVTLNDDTPIGAMAFLDHSRAQRRAELRKLIGNPDYRGRGLAEEATKLWVQYGIQKIGLKKIYVSTLQTQIANIRLNESIGFEVEGILRNEVLIDGQRHDVLRMGLLVDEDSNN